MTLERESIVTGPLAAHIISVGTDVIDIISRMREIDPQRVKSLAESMEKLGLQTPITLWSPPGLGDDLDEFPELYPEEDKPERGLRLIAGAHRLEAAKLLGWEDIDAIFVKGDRINHQLWEIDENLIRAELSPTEQAAHLAKRRELWGELQSAQVAPIESKRDDGRGHRRREFASDTADATGINKSTINRALSRAKGVTQEARDTIVGTKLDKGTVLDDLKRLPADQQMDRIHELQRTDPPQPKSIEDAAKLIDIMKTYANGLSSIDMDAAIAGMDETQRIQARMLAGRIIENAGGILHHVSGEIVLSQVG